MSFVSNAKVDNSSFCCSKFRTDCIGLALQLSHTLSFTMFHYFEGYLLINEKKNDELLNVEFHT